MLSPSHTLIIVTTIGLTTNLPISPVTPRRYDIFGKYGAIRQIRVGNTPETRGTAFVVYEDIFDAKNACDHLSGFNVCNRSVRRSWFPL